MALPYQRVGLSLSRGAAANDRVLVKALQRDLRALGYLHNGIDGDFGAGTESAIRALQYDLLNNNGQSGGDGAAPVAITAYNRGDVTAITGLLDQNLAGCIARLCDDPAVPMLPSAADPAAANAQAMQALRAVASTIAPTPFIAAMLVQESGGRHFRVPSGADEDNFVVIGLDRNGATSDQITSRGYGMGQYTIFHHPARPDEIADFVVDPVRNVQRAFSELRDKFDNFVLGKTGATQAGDRIAEHPLLPLRLCKFKPSEAEYMQACQACAQAAKKVDIERGTPCYPGASVSYQPDQYYPSAHYPNVPDRADFGCDWPYAARRYNGSGNDSFHYQTRILRNLLAGGPAE